MYDKIHYKNKQTNKQKKNKTNKAQEKKKEKRNKGRAEKPENAQVWKKARESLYQ